MPHLQDASFRVLPGLANQSGVSLEASNFPGSVLRHEDFKIFLRKVEATPVFAGDATFHLEGAGVHHHPHHSRESSGAGYAPSGAPGYAPSGAPGYAPIGATVEFQRCVGASGNAHSVLRRTVCYTLLHTTLVGTPSDASVHTPAAHNVTPSRTLTHSRTHCMRASHMQPQLPIPLPGPQGVPYRADGPTQRGRRGGLQVGGGARPLRRARLLQPAQPQLQGECLCRLQRHGVDCM